MCTFKFEGGDIHVYCSFACLTLRKTSEVTATSDRAHATMSDFSHVNGEDSTLSTLFTFTYFRFQCRVDKRRSCLLCLVADGNFILYEDFKIHNVDNTKLC